MDKIKKGDRHKIYISFLNKEFSTSIKAFLNCGKEYGIPEITVRRDLKELEKFNYITIEMGLIKLKEEKEYEATRDEKILKNRDQKNRIALKAVELINNNEIFVGAGTTCEAFVKAITKKIKILYTNGFEVARIAKNNLNINRIVLIGGKLRPQSGAMCGPIANIVLEELRFSQSFITITNLDNEFNMFNNNEDEAYLTNKVIEKSNESICLIDNSKLNNTTYGNKIAKISKVNKLVIDSKPDDETYNKLIQLVDIK